MSYCSVCSVKYNKGTGNLFRVPKNNDERKKWSDICGVSLSLNSRVCADHFLYSDMVNAGNKLFLMPNAEPLLVQQNYGLDQSMKVLVTPTITNVVDTSIRGGQSANINNGINPWSLDMFPKEETESESQNQWKEEATQTDAFTFDMDGKEYFQRIRFLEAENKELKCQLIQANAALDAMRKIFTDGQIRKIMSPGRVQWQWQDISSAICLHAAGPRAYTHLYKKGFPLPHRSTLQRWCGKVDVSEGILSSAISFMKNTTDLPLDEKVCVLVFDEMKVAETYEYDPVSDTVKKPAKYVQVIIARGLKKSWKQPVFYDFDYKITKALLNNIIRQLYDSGFPVVATVCDMGPSNRKLLRDLGVTVEKPWFSSPICENDKVFAFADAPHLLKLIRNHFLDSGIIFNNTVISSRTIADLLALTSKSDMSITFKLTDEHLTVKGAGRQKVKLAAQIFSNTTASAIRRCEFLGKNIYNPTETANFFQLVNDWFDIMNSKLSNFNYPGKQPYGLALESQDEVLVRMSKLMSFPIVHGRTNLQPFQKGIIMTNSALMQLRQYVKKYNMTYLVTNRLNQDVLEHFFGSMRSKGGMNDHPSPLDFKYRLRKYILARNTEYLDGKGNAEPDSTEWLNASVDLSVLCSPEKTIEQDTHDIEESSRKVTDIELDDLHETNLEDIGILQQDALEYISGYIIRKLNLEEYECHTESSSWVDQVSKCSLKKPNDNFLLGIKKLEKIFYEVNRNLLTAVSTSTCP